MGMKLLPFSVEAGRLRCSAVHPDGGRTTVEAFNRKGVGGAGGMEGGSVPSVVFRIRCGRVVSVDCQRLDAVGTLREVGFGRLRAVIT